MSMDELADVLEVVYEIARRVSGIGELEKARQAKRAERGGFEEGLVLEYVEEG